MPIASTSKRTIASFLIQLAAIFLAVCLLLELAARTTWAQTTFPYRSVGNFDYQFEIKWFRLQDYARQNGGVDVILLGSSLVNTGIEPYIMERYNFEQTGKKLRIFNFGVEGLTVTPNSLIARLLIRKYHPALLIYVTEMRDYMASTGLEYQVPFLSSPWIRYQEGNPNVIGWLIDHSKALQYFLPYRNWMRADFPQTYFSLTSRSQKTSPDGYEPELVWGNNVDLYPNPSNPDDANYFILYGNFQISPARLESLQKILALKQEGTRIVVVEMPVHPTFYVFVGGETVHQQFQQTIASVVRSDGGTFIPAEACDIPVKGRANRWHLNYMGAPVFSRCLGERIAVLAHQLHTDFIHKGNGSK